MSDHMNPELVGTLTDSFHNWFQNDILPYFVASFDIITIVVGFILNVMLVVTFKKRGLFKDSSTNFVFMLSVSDFIAFVLVLLPTIIAAFAREWLLSFPVCLLHGSMTVLMLYVSFSFLAILTVERAVKLSNPELYEKTFDSKTFVSILTIAIWILSCVVVFVNIADIAEIKYDFYHQGCMLNYLSSFVLLNIHFGTTFGISFLILIISYTISFEARRRALKDARTGSFKHTASAQKRKETVSSKDSSDIKATDKHIRNLPSVSEQCEEADTGVNSEQKDKSNPRVQVDR